MLHFGTRAFDSIGGEVVSTTAFCLNKFSHEATKGKYFDLTLGKSENEKMLNFFEIKSGKCRNKEYIRSTLDFEKVPGSPLAYWASDKLLDLFVTLPALGNSTDPRSGMATGDNDRFLRLWSEVSYSEIGLGFKSREEAKKSRKHWFPYNKGGTFKRWYGNNEYLVFFYNDGESIKKTKQERLEKGLITQNNSKCWNQDCYFLPCLTWSALSNNLSMRYCDYGFIFDTKGQSLFADSYNDIQFYSAFLNSKVCSEFLKVLSPTLDFNSGYLRKIPDCRLKVNEHSKVYEIELLCREIAVSDWNSYEVSWDFKRNPFFTLEIQESKIELAFKNIKFKCMELVQEAIHLEEENNKLFINFYDPRIQLINATPSESSILSKAISQNTSHGVL